MTSVTDIKRKTTPLSFNQNLEFKLFTLPIHHTSLTEDIELCALKGLELLSELEEVTEITHLPQIAQLVEITNEYGNMDNIHYRTWHIEIAEDVLDEIELIILSHGEDLKELGLKDVSCGGVLLLAVITGLFHPDFAQLKY